MSGAGLAERPVRRRPETSPPLRGFAHVLAALCAWILFVAWWRRVLPTVRREDLDAALLFIALTALVSVVLTAAWVRHNVAIYRRKGPRTRLPEVAESVDRDALGRTYSHPGTEALRRAPVVVVSVDGAAKRMDPGGAA